MIRRLIRGYLPEKLTGVKFSNTGYCLCCERRTRFIALNDWLRDYYQCSLCGSIPRERALMYCIEKYFPGWRECVVHESSPSRRKVSQRLKRQAGQYIPSQYYPEIEPGKWYKGARSEDLERMTFEDDSIDLHVTQDVMEHVFNPDRAFAEIARTLRPGGAHIFTVPLVNKDKPTEICAMLDDTGKVVYLREPEYHVNPVSRRGSLVTRRWGYDIRDFIFRCSGLSTEIVNIDSLDYGIRAEFNEVLITIKP